MTHVSVDFWNTLATPNPIYAEKRNKWLAAFYGKDPSVIPHIHASVKATIDQTHCANAMPLSWNMCYAILHEKMGTPGDTIPQMKMQFEYLFAKHPPIINANAVAAIASLRSKGITVSIGSNTNFIRGKDIKSYALEPSKLKFDFCLFSDELGVAKPHKLFWDVLKQEIPEETNIIHIGDNRVCDFEGPRDSHIDGRLISGPREAAELLYHLNEVLHDR